VAYLNSNDNNKESSKAGRAGANWLAGVEIFTQISTWIVVPIVCALVFGKMLDKQFGTEPVIFISLTGLAFIFTCYGMVRVVKDYIKKIKEVEENKTE